ncbi:quinone oxidoreductase family protein [Cryptosporangium aurantiacum]|uniref:NADPH:quinone reductase n=1 Tax=Cryptosporangium aurantiacum TaxID=134849 RepID=A0A1M7RBL0_9ACTN|nr:zinc-binding alcohol dehydrogenase family protein [Cryptosporangium aurantiacum]SHN43448.1 NADPH:quinone reductase [Cryptosporangium aurantiacum]
MRAAQIVACGRPPVVSDVAEPPADGTSVLVEVLAAPITPLDLLCASGTSYFGTPPTPYVPGVQGVGRYGGRTVWFPTSAGMAPGDGSMAQMVAIPASDLVELPPGADPVAIAAAGLSAVAAYAALTWTGALTAGERVVVLGAGGVVGQAAVQLARLAGAAQVVAGARSTAAQRRARAAGADVVVPLDTDDVDALADRFARACPDGADLVLDALFGAPAAAALRALRPGGRLVNLGSSAGATAPFDSATLRSRSLRVLGYTNNALTPADRADAVRTIAEAVDAGRLDIAREVVPLEDVAAAWERQATGAAEGRVVLTT